MDTTCTQNTWTPRGTVVCGRPAAGTLADGTAACTSHLNLERARAEHRPAPAREDWAAVLLAQYRAYAEAIVADVTRQAYAAAHSTSPEDVAPTDLGYADVERVVRARVLRAIFGSVEGE